MTKYNYTNFIRTSLTAGRLHELVKNAVFNSCNVRFVIRVIKIKSTPSYN